MAEGGERPGPQNGTIPLDDRDGVWSVGSGYVDIFSIVKDGSGRTDRPLHHARIASGGLLFGMPAWAEGDSVTCFIARLGPEAVVSAEPPRPAFLAAAVQDAADITGNRARIEAWASAIAGGPARDDAHRAGADGPRKGQGDAGQSDAVRAVVEALGSGQAHELEQALDRLHEAALQKALVLRGQRKAREAALLTARARGDAFALEDAWLSLASVAATTETAPFYAAAPVEDSLFRAASMSAAPLGIALNPPPAYGRDEAAGRTLEEAVLDIARASHVRVRPVTLRGRWWTEDHGPLLGFHKEERRPVALLPGAPGTYTLHDPDRPDPVPITEETAAKLSSRAYSWYPTLPRRALTPWDLITLAFAHRGREVAAVRIEAWAAVTTQGAIWDRLLNLPMAFFRRFATGDLAERAMKIDLIRGFVFAEGTTLLFSVTVGLVNAAVLITYSPRLAGVALAFAAFGVFVTVAVCFWLVRLHRQRSTLNAQLSGRVFEIVDGIAKLRTAGAETRAFRLWAKPFGAMKSIPVRWAENILTTFHSVYPLFATTALYLYYNAAPHSLSPGRFLGFAAAFAVLLTSVHEFSRFLVAGSALVPAYEKAQPILETVPEARDPARRHPGRLRGEIEVSRIHFAYTEDGPFVLKDVSLRAAPGEFIAIVGPSGSGKSTLLRLIAGFEQPTSGAVYFDGQDLASLDLQAVRAQMGIVPQDGAIFSGDVFTNIAGSARITVDEAWEAARKAGLAEDIKALPMGMHTYVSETTFSGGQRQRLLVARALARKPRILLLDEATSAMDERAEAIVRASTEQLKATRIVVAHRLSTIAAADRIYVLDHGRIVESGTYDELMAKGGLFTRPVRRQLA